MARRRFMTTIVNSRKDTVTCPSVRGIMGFGFWVLGTQYLQYTTDLNDNHNGSLSGNPKLRC